jgi:hypothetical protein
MKMGFVSLRECHMFAVRMRFDFSEFPYQNRTLLPSRSQAKPSQAKPVSRCARQLFPALRHEWM